MKRVMVHAQGWVLAIGMLFSTVAVAVRPLLELDPLVVKQMHSALTEDQRYKAFDNAQKVFLTLGIDIGDGNLTVESVAEVVREKMQDTSEGDIETTITALQDHISTAGQLIWALPENIDKKHGAYLTSFYADKRPEEQYRRSLAEVLESATSGKEELISINCIPGLGDGFTFGPTYAQMIWEQATPAARANLKIELVAPGFTHKLYTDSRDCHIKRSADYVPYEMVKGDHSAGATVRWRAMDVPHYTGMPAENLKPWAVADPESEAVETWKQKLDEMVPEGCFPLLVAATLSSDNPVPGGRRLRVEDTEGNLQGLRDIPWRAVVHLCDAWKFASVKPYPISLHGDMNPVSQAQFGEIGQQRESEAGIAECWARYSAVGKGADADGYYSVISDDDAGMKRTFGDAEYPAVATFPDMIKFNEFPVIAAAAVLLGNERKVPVKAISCDTGPANLAAACKYLENNMTFIFNGAAGLSLEDRVGGTIDNRWAAPKAEGVCELKPSNAWYGAQHLYTDGNLDDGLQELAKKWQEELPETF